MLTNPFRHHCIIIDFNTNKVYDIFCQKSHVNFNKCYVEKTKERALQGFTQRNHRQIRHISFMIFAIPSCLPFHRQFPAPPILKVPLRASLPIDARSNARSFLPSLTAGPIRSLMKPILRKQERKELPPSRKGRARPGTHAHARSKKDFTTNLIMMPLFVLSTR